MAALTDAQRRQLLAELREMGRASSAELEVGPQFKHAFHPIREHLRVVEPNVYLIIGYHGAGKSMLFRAAVDQLLFSRTIQGLLGHDLLLHRYAGRQVKWLAGYPRASDFPDVGALRRFVARWPDERRRAQALAELWLAYLARLLCDELDAPDLATLLAPSGAEIDRIADALEHQRSAVIKALDALDGHLQRDERWIFVSYDELDTLGGTDWALMVDLIRGLLTFWSEYMRRWQRLQPKIFLRTDLFANARVFAADFAKLAANRLELTWSDRNLYAMLIKRMANTSDAWLAYCRDAGVRFEQDDQLGWIPHLPNLDAARPLIERITGPFMGTNIKKGRTFFWVLDHLRDGHGQITPRNLVSLWGYAAAQELDAARAGDSHILHPTSLRRALDQVSDEHLRTLRSREMPWLAELAERLAGCEVPMTRQEWEALLARDWPSWREQVEPGHRPPRQTPAELLDFMIGLGVCRWRPDGRIDVPDLFLHGLGIKRRGGVKR